MSLDKDFYERIYDIVKCIPKGRVTTYGHIARCLGASRSSRVVGWAMNQSHSVDPSIPAHRVVNRNGLLTGKMHFSTPDEMQLKLESEGVKVEGNRVTDFAILLWDPAVLAEEIR